MVRHPFGRTLQLGDIPRPNFVWPDREQFRLGIGGMNSLTPALACLIPGGQQPIHGAYCAVISAFIEQNGTHRGRGYVGETLAVEQPEQHILLGWCVWFWWVGLFLWCLWV